MGSCQALGGLKARYTDVGALLLLVHGALLGVGSGSGLSQFVLPYLKATASATTFVYYGSISVALVVLVTPLLLIHYRTRMQDSRRCMTRAWTLLTLPVSSLFDGLGIGFFAGTFMCLVGVQWSAGSMPPLRLVGLVVLSPRWVLLPLGVLIITLAARSFAEAMASFAALWVGYEAGWPVAHWATNLVWYCAPRPAEHEVVPILSLGGILLYAMLSSIGARWPNSPLK